MSDAPGRGDGHRQAEIHFIAAGAGTLTIDGIERVIAAGAAAFIPGDAPHGLTA